MQQATAAQLRALTVPGTLPGVIRNCTPVRVNDGTVSYRTISTGISGGMAGLVGTPPAPLGSTRKPSARLRCMSSGAIDPGGPVR